MFYFSRKRQKVLASFFSLSLSLVIIVSCTPAVITLKNLTIAATTVVNLIDSTEKLFYRNSSSVNTSYGELKENLESERFTVDPEFSTSIIKKMEERHENLSTQQKELNDSLNQTKDAASKLFTMLETRANNNTNTDLRKESLRSISVTQKDFTNRIIVAEEVSSKIKVSIQNYDDVLNYLQINTILTGARDKFIPMIDSVISQYEQLNQEAQVALNEGRQVIKNTPGVSIQTPEGSSSIPTTNEDTPRIPATTTATPSESVPPAIANQDTTQEPANRPVLGVQMVGLTPEVRQKIQQNKNLENLLRNVDKGLLVVKVLENSSAADAGIQLGDVIVRVNDKAVTEPEELTVELGKYQVGEDLPLVVHRNQQNLEVVVRLKANPNTSN